MNKPIRRWMVFLVCIAFAGQLLVGCSAKSQGVKTDRSDKKQLKIGFTIDTLVLERWTRDRDVFTAVAQELGAQVEDGRNRDRCSGFLWTDGRGG